MCRRALHFRVVALRFSHEKGGRFTVQGIGRIGIAEELRDEHLEDVNHIVHGGPCLVDDVETD